MIIRRVLTALAAVLLVSALAPAPAQAAPKLVQITGAGSSWSANAIDNWRRNVEQNGIFVNYSSTGSTDGRNQFRNGTADFGVSEIPYGLRDSFGGTDSRPGRSFAYMPIVAGGTAFMYNLTIGGRRVTNLRLSGDVVTKIFTGVIKRWNDPAIKADNPGLNLPARNIVPVVRQDGSGTSAQFTLWMSKEHPALWNAYCRKFGKSGSCGITSNYPFRSSDGFVGQSGSTGVAGYVSQRNAEGAITYVEYSYAINARFPVAKLLNRSGYYVEPTASNVAVALLKAKINNTASSPDYLTQILDGVYRDGDRRTYPLSSYSYMIVPTKAELNITVDKGYTISEFARYFLCGGQRQADVLGYSPLPRNLVEAGLSQARRIPGANTGRINIADCNNPTFSRDGTNTLARNAPQPSACDKRGPTQNPAGTGGARQETPVAAAARCGGGGGTTAGGGNGGTNGTGTGGAGTPTPGASGVPNGGLSPSAGPGVIDPETGELVAAGQAGGGEMVSGVPVSLAATGGWRIEHTMMLLAGLLMIGLVLGPPLLSHTLRGRRNDSGDVR